MQRDGFSLVELAIVLVILGLITGGILAGQSLIRASELRSVSTEYNKFVTAVASFQTKYDAIPGDFNEATRYWTQAAVCPGNSTQGNAATTCNGNGDGRVWMNAVTNPTLNEIFRFWQHLALAGLIEGSYDGVTGDPGGYFAGGSPTNLPRSKSGKNAVWSVGSEDNRSGASNGAMFAYDMHISFLLGGFVQGSWPYLTTLRPDEAWNIDTKMDDGQPGRGTVLSRVGNNCTNAANGFAFNATYMLDQTGANCHLNMIYR